ncbi:C2 domain-containing protein [Tanacetum coccineum]
MAYMKEFEHLKIQLEAIYLATNNFSNENLIGQGGFWKLYKGIIDHSLGQETMVALRRLDGSFGQGNSDFWKEIIMMLSAYKHENIISLLGYCDDSGEKILAYEYASRKRLDRYFNNDELTWVRRLKICIGAARGLAYLHSSVGTQQRVLHRYIKSSNILLDENWNAKIADFGLSKFSPANKQFSQLISNNEESSGSSTKESDVYSFGVVLFELLCGRLFISNNDGGRQTLIGLVRDCHKENKVNEIICGKIKDQITASSLKEFIAIAYRCLENDHLERPLMTEIVKALEGSLKCQCSDAGGSGGEKTKIAGILNVKLIRVVDLKKGNPYLILHLTDDNLNSKRKTSVHHGKVDPEWNEEFNLYVTDSHDQSLEIYIQNATSVEMHDVMGCVTFGIRSVTLNDTHNVYHKNRVTGAKIMLEMVYNPVTCYTAFEDVCPVPKASIGTPQGGGLLVVIVHYGHNLREKHHHNPYISLLFRGESRRTMSIKNVAYPKWEEEFTFILEEPPTNEELHLEVISTPWRGLIYRKEESMGHANIRVADIMNKKRTNKKYDLQNGSGSVQVELQWRTSD